MVITMFSSTDCGIIIQDHFPMESSYAGIFFTLSSFFSIDTCIEIRLSQIRFYITDNYCKLGLSPSSPSKDGLFEDCQH